MLNFSREFLILGEVHSKYFYYFSHEGVYVTVLFSWELNGVVDPIKIPSQYFLVVVLYSITILHFLSAMGSKPLWPVTLGGGKNA